MFLAMRSSLARWGAGLLGGGAFASLFGVVLSALARRGVFREKQKPLSMDRPRRAPRPSAKEIIRLARAWVLLGFGMIVVGGILLGFGLAGR
jgi:hypothetical protein